MLEGLAESSGRGKVAPIGRALCCIRLLLCVSSPRHCIPSHRSDSLRFSGSCPPRRETADEDRAGRMAVSRNGSRVSEAWPEDATRKPLALVRGKASEPSHPRTPAMGACGSEARCSARATARCSAGRRAPIHSARAQPRSRSANTPHQRAASGPASGKRAEENYAPASQAARHHGDGIPDDSLHSRLSYRGRARGINHRDSRLV